jgi:parallel beta-helix repeat protein
MKSKFITTVFVPIVLILSVFVPNVVSFQSRIEVRVNQADLVHNLDTELNYTTIQEAIDAPETANGHTIMVSASTFNENIVVNKALRILGEDKSTTVIDGNGTAIAVTTNGVMIANLTLRNQAVGSCIELRGVRDCRILDDIFINDRDHDVLGVSLSDYSSFNNISQNQMIGRIYSVDFGSTTSYNVFASNLLLNTTRRIQLGGSHNTVMENSFLGEVPDPYHNFVDYAVVVGGISNVVGANRFKVSGLEHDIRVEAATNASVQLNEIDKRGDSLTLYYSSPLVVANSHNCSILNNAIYGFRGNASWVSTRGIQIGGTYPADNTGNILSGNMIEGFDVGVEIPTDSVSGQGSLEVSGNTLRNNEYGIFLGRFTPPGYTGSSNNILLRNSLSNNDYGIYVENWGSSNVIADNIISNSIQGIFLANGHGNSIQNNTLRTCTYGILEGPGRSNNISTNDISLGYYGIYCGGSSQDVIIDNIVTYNNNDGIFVNACDQTEISSNFIAHNNNGIRLFQSNGSQVFMNSISDNNGDGIHIEQSSDNILKGNSITSNFGYGIWVFESFNNSVFHNNFNNIRQAFSLESFDYWDDGYPSGGNYWSDYTGIDVYHGTIQDVAGGDGIGDTAFAVATGSIDHYPLMGPFGTFDAGTWNNTLYRVDIVSNSTITDFNFDPYVSPYPTLSFSVTGINGSTGFCRVTIPKGLMWVNTLDEWTIRVNGTLMQHYINETGGYTYIYFNYPHSRETVQIQSTGAVPEFQPLMLALLVIATLVGAIFFKKKQWVTGYRSTQIMGCPLCLWRALTVLSTHVSQPDSS